jgi:ABC-type multidrug transport system fused ATPase/permease subunit
MLLRQGLLRAIGPAGATFLPVLERYTWVVPVSALLSLLASALEGFGIGLLIPLLTEFLGATASPATGVMQVFARVAAVFPPAWRIVGVAACIFGAILVKAALQTLYWVIVASVHGKAGHDIRAALSQQLLSLGYSFFLRHDPIRLVTIVSTESWRASDAIRLAFAITASAGAVVVFAGLMFAVSWKLSLLVVAGVLMIRLAQVRFARRLERLSDRVATTNRELAARMMTIIEAMRLIRVFGQQEREQERFTQASDGVRRALLDVERNASVTGPLFEVLHAALFIAILLVAQRIGLSLAAIITFLALLYRMQPHLMTLSRSRLGLASLRGPVREVAWLLDPGDKPLPPPGKASFTALSAPLVFEHVGFSYPARPESDPALVDLSFVIHPKRALAILGPSGAGKSTLVNLLCRLLEPTSGRITLAGRDVAEIDPRSWLARVALAGQDIDLIDARISDNIAYGKPDASIEEIQHAARQADADKFIRELPEGYATTVGSRGLSLSSGQRQRIGIARALLRDPELLILDEATNAVDGISEAAIMSLIERRAGDRMTIVISHRPSTIASCQDGIVLDGGRLVEWGPLAELSYFERMSKTHASPGTRRNGP